MIIYGNTAPILLIISFVVIGLFGISLGGIVKGLFGGGSSTSSKADYDAMIRKQEEMQRQSEQRMQMLLLQQQKSKGMEISPIMMIGGIAIVALVFLPKMIGGR